MTPVSAGYDVRALRDAEFPWADGCIYLNHAGIGPLPERARHAIEAYTRDRAAPTNLPDAKLMGVLAGARERAARLINAETGEIALATNTSFGLNVAACMLPMGPGDVVLVSHGEFPANVHPWARQAERGVTMELLPLTPEGWPDEERMIERMADPGVKVLALSQVQFHTGYHADMDRLSAAARATGTYFVVDAIQALGHLPLDVRKTPVDILACGAQKWLLSPWGSGFMYVRKELIPGLRSPFAGWTAFEGTDDFSTLLHHDMPLRSDARRYELVTLPFQDFLGMNHALDLLEELGVECIAAHVAAIGAPVREWAGRRGVRLMNPADRRDGGMICLDARDLPGGLEALRAAGVATCVREGALRLSPHCYNTMDEMVRVTKLLDATLGG